MRVAAYIDGFNLYHAIDELDDPILKWCDLWGLMQSYVHAPDELSHVTFYSAYNTWDGPKRKRHVSYVAALEQTGVTPRISNFKDRSAIVQSRIDPANSTKRSAQT